MSDTIRWGILGTGFIARQFAEGLKSAHGAVLQAVGSRAMKTANTFGDLFNVPNRHASYEALVADPEVDVIYVSTPHPLHKENSILCLEAGKAVLCEKPFTINRREAEEVVACARDHKRFLMEAMWTRFLPTVVQAAAWVREGVIGEVRMVRADFGFRADYNEESRLFTPEMGGGGLLDDVLGPQPTNVNRGNDVLGQIFGSKDVSRAVAQNAATSSGLDPSLLKKMLPMLAMLVAGYMAKQGGAAAAAPASGGGVLGSLLGGLLGGGRSAPAGGGGLASLLDLNKDGNPLDDILGMAAKLRR